MPGVVTPITVTPTTTQTGATVAYTDDADTPLTDADTTPDNGFQVDLDEGSNTIKVVVTSGDGNTMRTYTVHVERAGPAMSGPSGSEPVGEDLIEGETTTASVVVDGDTVTGVLTWGDLVLNGGSGDWFTVELEANTEYRFKLFGSPDVSNAQQVRNPQFQLYDSNDNDLGSFDLDKGAGNSENETITPTGATGTHYVLVSGLDTGAYSLEVKTVDATLSDLTLTNADGGDGIDLTPTFAADVLPYTASVINDVATVTVAGTANHSVGTVTYSPADTDDDSSNGHQVDLAAGAETDITVKVTDTGGTTQDYIITVTRLPVIAIAANHAMIGGGLEDLVFTLTREGATTSEVTVAVDITQDAASFSGALQDTATFDIGDDETKVTLSRNDFSLEPTESWNLTATVTAASGVADTVEVVAIDGPPVIVKLDQAAYSFPEGGPPEDVEIFVVATLNEAFERAPAGSFRVKVSPTADTADTATAPEDFTTVANLIRFRKGDYAEDGNGNLVASKRYGAAGTDPLSIDDDDAYEGDETLKVVLESAPGGLPVYARIEQADGAICDSDQCTAFYPVTITDEDDLPELALAVSSTTISEEDDGGTPGAAENVATVTVSIADAKTSAIDQLLTLIFGGTAATTAYAVAPEDEDDATDGHQVTLPAGAPSVELTLTAAANDSAGGAKSITVAGSRGGTVFGTEQTVTIVDEDTSAMVTGIAFTSPPDDGVYDLGEDIELSVTFDQAVDVTGAPRVQMTVSGTDVYADYVSADSTATVLVFRWAVTGAVDDHTDPLIASATAKTLELNGGTIVNAGTTVDAALAHDSVDTMDGVRTRLVESIAVTSTPRTTDNHPNGTGLSNRKAYGSGETVEITVTFADTVTLDTASGSPVIEMTSPSADISALHGGGSGTALTFTWTIPADFDSGALASFNVPPNHADSILDENRGLALNGAALTDSQGRVVNIRHDEFSGILGVDASPPALDTATVNGTRLELGFLTGTVTDKLDPASLPAADDFTITVTTADGNAADPAPEVTGVAIDDGTLTLTLTQPVRHGDGVTLGYTPGTNPLRDLWLNNAEEITSRMVTNNTTVCAIDTSGRTEKWSAELTVAALSGGSFGYLMNDGGNLSETEFTIGTSTHMIDAVAVASDDVLYFGLVGTTDFKRYERNALVLHVCGDTFVLKNRDRFLIGVTYIFDTSGLDWSTTTSVSLALSIPPNTVATGAPEISGTPEVGETLTADAGTIADADRLGSDVSYSYQWVRVDGTAETVIHGATAETYTVDAADEGKSLKVRASFEDRFGNAEMRTSTQTAAVPVTASVVAPGLAATGMHPAHELWGVEEEDWHGAIALCWTPSGMTPGADFEPDSYELRYRHYGPGLAEHGNASGGRTPADFRPWREAPRQYPYAIVANPQHMTPCDGGAGIGFNDRVMVGYEYTYQMRATRMSDGTSVESDAVTGTAYNPDKPLRTTIRTVEEILEENVLTADGLRAPVPNPVPESMGSFVAGICFANGQPLLIHCGPVEGFDIAADLTLTNATAELAMADYDSIGGWLLRVTPTTWGDDVTIAVKNNAVTAGGMSSEPTRRTWQTTTAMAQQAGPGVTGTTWGGDTDGDGRWSAGEAVEVHMTFDSPVSVSRGGGTPRVTLLIAETPVAAAYARGSDTTTLVFGHTLTAGSAAVEAVLLEANSLTLNGGGIAGADGTHAALEHAGAAYSAPPRSVRGTLTAAFKGMPDEHDGSAFRFKLRFSEAPSGLSFRTMRNAFFTVTGGAVTKAKRVEKGSNLAWRVTVEPEGYDAVGVSFVPTLDCAAPAAVCTEDGRPLMSGASTMVLGPAALSVADAETREAADAVLAFAVTLDRAAGRRITVDYATADGSATAGADYTQTSGTLVFAIGERAKTVNVPILDDDHDEGAETLTLTLANATGARIEDAVATGTIVNSDAMPKAWLVRFGRTVAEQVLDAVEDRIAAPPRAGTEVRVAGVRVSTGAGATHDTARLEEVEAAAEARAGLRATTDWLRGEDENAHLGERTITERDLLTGTSFALTSETAAGGTASLWGRGALSRFRGREDTLVLDGEVATGMVGADWTQERWTAGVMVAHALGDGSYRGEDGRGTVESALTGLYPYGRYGLNDRVTLWGAAGYGSGSLTLTPQDQPAMETDIDLAMAGLGVRGVLVEAPASGGPELAATSDAMGVRTTSAAVRSHDGNLAASQAQVTRLRLGLEGTWRGLTMGGGELTPRLEVGVRHDGGDAETGFGLDLGGGLAWDHPGSGIAAEVSGRGLLTHEAGGFRERGIAGSLAWDPRPETERGMRLTLRQTMGASATGGMDALLGRTTLAGLAANDNGNGGGEFDNRRLELRFGYGFSAFSDRFTSIPEIGLGLSDSARDVSLGWRLVQRATHTLELGIEATRHEPAGDRSGERAPEHAIGVRLDLGQRGPNAVRLGVEATRRESANDDREADHAIRLRLTARW